MNFLSIRNSLLAVAAAGAVYLPTHSRAANYNYHVDVNVLSLLGTQTSGTYYLDFQLNGDGLPASATNAVTLSNFVSECPSSW